MLGFSCMAFNLTLDFLEVLVHMELIYHNIGLNAETEPFPDMEAHRNRFFEFFQKTWVGGVHSPASIWNKRDAFLLQKLITTPQNYFLVLG